VKRTYLITHGAWLVLALAVAAEAGRLGFGSFSRPGPGFLPFLAGIALAALALLALIQTALATPAEDSGGGFRQEDLIRIGTVAGVLFLYVFLWDVIGFLTATTLLLLFLFRCVEPLRWRTVFLATGVTLAITHILFSVLLGARLPTGRLWTYLLN
jgi:putative tricarboxylic transport membrane protein